MPEKKAASAKNPVLQQKSAAEFFAEVRTVQQRRWDLADCAEFLPQNKHFAGFDNVRCSFSSITHVEVDLALAQQPGKSLYTTLRELIENGLDAAEAIGEHPDLEITMYAHVFE